MLLDQIVGVIHELPLLVNRWSKIPVKSKIINKLRIN